MVQLVWSEALAGSLVLSSLICCADVATRMGNGKVCQVSDSRQQGIRQVGLLQLKCVNIFP